MDSIFSWISGHWDQVLLAITSVVTAASLIAKLTPTEVDDKLVQKVLDFINALALNKKK